MTAFVLAAPFILAILMVVAFWIRERRERRHYLTTVAWHQYALRRKRFESDKALRQRCMDRLRLP